MSNNFSFSTYEEALEAFFATPSLFNKDSKIYCEEDNSWYKLGFLPEKEKDLIYNKIGLKKFSPNDEHALTIYQMNQALIGQCPLLTEAQLKERENYINKVFEKTTDKHYLLMGAEISYYTILERMALLQNCSLGKSAIACAQDVGKILSIDFDKVSGAIEFWVQNPETKKATMLLLIPYEEGVVFFG